MSTAEDPGSSVSPSFSVDISEVVANAESNSSASFDDNGRTQLSLATSKFSNDLAKKAAGIASDFDSPTVGEVYVRDAARSLLARGGWRSQLALTFGGILVGGAVSGVIGMAAASEWPVAAIIGSMLAAAGGMFLIGSARSL